MDEKQLKQIKSGKFLLAVIPADAYPDFPQTAKYSNYEKRPCDGCQEACWVGDKGLALLNENPEAKKICPGCLFDVFGEQQGSMMLKNIIKLYDGKTDISN